MANIALVTDTTSHATYTNTKALLESFGHVVTGYTSVAVTNANLMAADLICACRTTNNTAYSDKIAAAHAAGKPVLCGSDGAVTAGTVYTNSVAARCGLVLSQVATQPMGSAYAHAASPIYDAAGVVVPASIQFYPTGGEATWYCDSVPIASGSIAPGAQSIMQDRASSPTKDVIVCALTGGGKLGGGTFAAPIIFSGFFYGASGYTTLGGQLIRRMVEWLLSGGGSFKFTGTVKDSAGAFIARKVRVFRRDTGGLIGETTSNATTGVYDIRVLTGGFLATVVCYDADGGTKNALVKDKVAPVGV